MAGTDRGRWLLHPVYPIELSEIFSKTKRHLGSKFGQAISAAAVATLILIMSAVSPILATNFVGQQGQEQPLN